MVEISQDALDDVPNARLAEAPTADTVKSTYSQALDTVRLLHFY